MVIFDPDEYDEYVQELAESYGTVDGSHPNSIAEMSIISQQPMESEMAITTIAQPWHDERITPSAVIFGSEMKQLPPEPSTLRALAVFVLTEDLIAYINDHDITPAGEQ